MQLLRAPIHWFAAAYVLIALAVIQHHGTYTPFALFCMLAAFAIACVGVSIAVRQHHETDASPTFLAGCIVLLLLMGLSFSPLLHDKSASVDRAVHGLQWAILVGVLLLHMLPRPQWLPSWVVWMFDVAFIAAGIALRFLVPTFTPVAMIDVYVTSQESAQHFLAGLNPYTTAVTDIYGGKMDFGYDILGYMYLPATLYLQTIGYLFGDVRYMSAFADAVIALSLWRLTKEVSRNMRCLLILLFLWHPKGFFVVEQSWTEPLIAMFLGIFLMLRSSGFSLAAAGIYGYMLSIKQSLAFFALQLLRLERRPSRLLIVALVGILTIIPFAIWDMESLWKYGVLFQLQTGFRADGLTIFAPLSKLGLEPGKSWSLIVGFVATIGAMWFVRKLPQMRGYLLATCISTFAMFLFGSQAFCNYYYLVWVLLLFVMAEAIAPVQHDDR